MQGFCYSRGVGEWVSDFALAGYILCGGEWRIGYG